MTVRRRQQAHQQRRLLQAELAGRSVEVDPGSVLESEADAQIHPVEITQQQFCLAEAALQLQGHQQFPPLAFDRVALPDLIGVKAAGQLLGETAASLQHLATHDIGDQCPQGADGIDARMPPEAVVLAGQQCIDDGRREILDTAEFAVALGISRSDRLVVPVVDGDRTLNRGQPPAHRDTEIRQQQQGSGRAETRNNQCAGQPGQTSSGACPRVDEAKGR